MSETKTDVASSPFDVVKANEHLDSITACSDCEDFIDRIEEYIDNVKKTVGVLDDIQKLRLISEIQCLALKASRKTIRLQNREFKDYSEELKRLNQNKFPTTPSPSKAKRGTQKRSTTSVPGTFSWIHISRAFSPSRALISYLVKNLLDMIV
ncbi:hypothetical protein TNCV_2632861, partial [Trichonephila clavipes]